MVRNLCCHCSAVRPLSLRCVPRCIYLSLACCVPRSIGVSLSRCVLLHHWRCALAAAAGAVAAPVGVTAYYQLLLNKLCWPHVLVLEFVHAPVFALASPFLYPFHCPASELDLDNLRSNSRVTELEKKVQVGVLAPACGHGWMAGLGRDNTELQQRNTTPFHPFLANNSKTSQLYCPPPPTCSCSSHTHTPFKLYCFQVYLIRETIKLTLTSYLNLSK